MTLNQASQERRPISIKVLSWNINGDNSAGFSTIRSDVVTGVVLKTSPDVILLQEIQPRNTPAKINRFTTMYSNKYYKEAVGEGNKAPESQVLYDSSQYAQIGDTKKLFPIDSDVAKKSLTDLLDQAKDEVFSETSDKLRQGAFEDLKKVFDERISIVGLRMKVPKQEGPLMIFLSFHNVYKSKGADVRARGIEGFCKLVTKLHNLTGCVVLAGADFNQQLIKPYPYPTILDYTPTPRRLKSGQIDYFILEPADCLDHHVEAWNLIDSIKHGYLIWLATGIILYLKKVREPPNMQYRQVCYRGTTWYIPYRLPTIKDCDKMIPHDPLLCTFRVPG